MARVQKGQSYDNLGFRVDKKGTATDTNTGKSLSRKQVDRLLSGSGMDNIKVDRGGINGFYDHNKKWLNPVIEAGLGMIPGIGVPLSMAYGAAAGANSLRNPNLKGALMGAASGYGMGKLGGSVKTGLGKMLGGGAPTPSSMGALTDVQNAGKSMTSGQLDALRFDKGLVLPPAPTIGAMDRGAMQIADAGGLGGGGVGSVGSAVTPSAGGAARSTLGRVSDTMGRVGGEVGSKLGAVANWAEKHPVALKAAEGAFKMMAPPVVNPADIANADRQNFELQRQQAGMASGSALSEQLKAQLEALMRNAGRPALSNPIPYNPAYPAGR